MAIAMSVLDSTIANVALPTLAHEFRTSDAASVWVVNAYQIAILVLLLPLASLGEIVGYRRISQSGLAIFTLASVCCALAPSLLTLTIARVVQGAGAAGIMAVNAALVRFTYPQHMLGRAIGINAFVVACSAAVGPTIASAVLALATWRWLFAINVPIGVIALGIALYALPHTERAVRRLNPVGALLHVATFALLLSGLQALAHDEATGLAGAQIGLGCLLGWIGIRHELGRSAPLIPFDLLRIPLFSLSIAASVCSFCAQMAALVALPFMIQGLGHGASQTGLLMTPWPVAVAIAAPVAGRLADRYPGGILGVAGLITLTAGLLLLGLYPRDGTTLGLIWRTALCGLGFGLFQSPNNRTMLSTAPRARSGAAGGMLSTARLLGHALGAAGVAILFRAFPGRGPQVALLAAAVCAFIAAAVSLARLPHSPDARAAAPPR